MATSSSPIRLAVLGAGKMGGILVEAFVKHRLVEPKNIFATVQHPGQPRKNLAGSSVSIGTDNRSAAKKADVILLCVKPQTVGPVLDEIRRELSDKKLLISIAASVPTDYIERKLGGKIPVHR
jgi:pyrroline-5-carboxylate reductase